MSKQETQLHNEWSFSKKHIDRYITEEIMNSPVLVEKIQEGVKLLQTWLVGSYYPSKMERLGQVMLLDLEALTLSVFVGTAYCRKPDLFTSVTAQLAGRLGFDEKISGIKTMAEIVAVLCHTDVYDINRNDSNSLEVVSNIKLSDDLVEYIQESSYLPPMVCKPMQVTKNYHSGYLTHNESVILKSNHHNDPLALDVLNIQNQTALKLDRDFLCNVEEEPNGELDTPEKQKSWTEFKRQSYGFYIKMCEQAEELYLTHKFDKRGRMYAQGYHISTQGTPFKKAMLEFADEEVVQGAPQ